MERFIGINSEKIKQNIIHLKQIVFEVTDACNLRCKYCGYSDLYEGYDKRENLYLKFEQAKLIIDYLYGFWHQNQIYNGAESISIGFYGGEPLLNVPFIEKVINYLERLPDAGKKFRYNITTNAMLLDRYMDFLVEKEFRLLISLDGDYEGQGYRVDALGRNSFHQVVQNVQKLRVKYPDYFNRFVNFNAVLHNRNSVESIFRFIKDNFNKTPAISPLNNSGIRKNKLDEYNQIHRNYIQSLKSSSNCETLSEELFIKNPETKDLMNFIHKESGNVYRTYNELFFKNKYHQIVPTGTCTPFAKKMFITVKGRILQCERINHEFAVGQILADKVELDFDQIAQWYNELVFKYSKQCEVCALNVHCPQCVFQIDDIHERATRCLHFCTPEKLRRGEENILEYLGEHPMLYKRLLRNVVIRG